MSINPPNRMKWTSTLKIQTIKAYLQINKQPK